MLVPKAARTGFPISSPRVLTATSTRATRPHGLPGAGMEKRERRCREKSGSKPRRRTQFSAHWAVVRSVLPLEGQSERWLERLLGGTWPGRAILINDRRIRIAHPGIDYLRMIRGSRYIKPANRLNPKLQSANAVLFPATALIPAHASAAQTVSIIL